MCLCAERVAGRLKLQKRHMYTSDGKRLTSKEVHTDYSEQEPWSACFRLATVDTHFWDEQVRHPAAAWEAAHPRGAPLAPDGKVASLHLPGVSAYDRIAGRDASQLRKA